MKIGILGAGKIGQALAKKIAKAGIPLILSNSRGVESLKDLVTELGASATAGTNEDVATADIIILAVRWEKNAEVLGKLKEQLKGKIIVDATNRPKDDTASDPAKSSGQVVAALVPDSHLVKAFNTLFAKVLDADPALNGGRRVIFLSGDHPSANDAVKKLATDIGFAAVDLGRLEQGGALTDMGKVFSGLNLATTPA